MKKNRFARETSSPVPRLRKKENKNVNLLHAEKGRRAPCPSFLGLSLFSVS
jgi:hypothetical protein